MTMTEKSEMLLGERKILIGISFRENVVVLVSDGPMNELHIAVDNERPYRKTCQIISIRFRKNSTGPIDRPPRVRIELRGFVQTGCHAIMVTANRDSVKSAHDVDSFDRIWPITDDIPATEH